MPAETRRDPSGTFSALRHPVYRRIWAANLVSTVGDWMQIIGRGALVYNLTNSTSALGLIYFASYIPQLFMLPFGGVYADRYDRRRTLLGGQVLQLVFALLLGLMVSSGRASLALVVVISLGSGTVQAFTQPATSALTPALVPREDLSSAVSLSMTTNNLSRVIGPMIAGLVIPTVGVQWVFYGNAVSFIAVIGVWLVTRIVFEPEVEVEGDEGDFAAAWRYVRATPALMLPIAMVTLLAAIGLAYQMLGVAYATTVLAGGDHSLGGRYYGIFQACVGVGGLIGVIGLAGLARRRPALTLYGTAMSFSVLLIILGAVEVPAPGFVLCFLLGLTHFAHSNLVLTIVQHQAPDQMRGRIMSILMLGWLGIFPLTSLAIGWLAQHFGIPDVLTASGVICLAGALVLTRWRSAVPAESEPAEADPAAAALTQATEEA